jgi:hypothetical protein
MTTTSLKNLRGSLSTRTQDAPRHDALGTTLADIETNFGLLDPSDLAKVRAILEKYTGASSSTTNKLGGSRAGDAADAARMAAAVVRATVEHNAEVGRGYRDFWSQKNAEYAASIRK